MNSDYVTTRVKMSKVPQHVIDEATKLGIVEGARIKCMSAGQGTVGPRSEWEYHSGTEPYLVVGVDDEGLSLFGMWRGWAKVIAPAPSAPSQGLQEGDAVECGPAMRAAIIELARELGVPVTNLYKPGDDGMDSCRWDGRVIIRACPKRDPDLNWMTPEAFIAKMRATEPVEKPITIGERKVEFYPTGDIRVGCTRVDHDTLVRVYERAKKMKGASTSTY